jgi:tetratricopeptide (TPR) repeat protein
MKTRFILFRGIALLMVALNGTGTVRATEPFFEGLGSYSRKITTDLPRAQRYFNQGLAFLHGFNHGAAIRSFQEAARLDPKCPMAHWGVALACGPHINLTTVPARGIAFANLGKTSEAENEQKAFRDLVSKMPPDQMYDMLNGRAAVFKIHENLLAGSIAHSRHDDNAAIDFLKQAVTAEDTLNYSEPPPWYPPVRPRLGRLLLSVNRTADAEKVFRGALERKPRDARPFGLARRFTSAGA